MLQKNQARCLQGVTSYLHLENLTLTEINDSGDIGSVIKGLCLIVEYLMIALNF